MELKKVQEIFNLNMFVIPNYQRGYAWESAQVEDFLNDLHDAKDIDQHYTGQIIVAGKKSKLVGNTSYDVYEVVDGQQRLTTISLYILAVCNRLKALNEDMERIEDGIRYKNENILTLSVDNNDFYTKYILSNNEEKPIKFHNKAQKNLWNAKHQIAASLERHKTAKAIRAEYQTLMSKFKVSFSILTTQLEVGLVFETMNDRGIALNQMDKSKNYLIYLCNRMKDTKTANIINDCYSTIFSELMKVESYENGKSERLEKIEDDFLSCAYFLHIGKNFRDTVHQNIKIETFPKKLIIQRTSQAGFNFESTQTDNLLLDRKKKIKEFVEFLAICSSIYRKIYNADFKNPEINTLLKRIVFLGGLEKNSRLLLALFYSRKGKEETLISVLEILEKLVFRSKLKVDTSTLAITIRKKENFSIKDMRDNLKSLLDDNCSDKLFISGLKSIDFYDRNKTSSYIKIQYLFYYYEKYLADSNSVNNILPNFDDFMSDSYNKFEIEHIDPLKPISRKPSELVNQIGNLTPTFNNQSLSNKEFSDKKSIYRLSTLCSEKAVSNLDVWNDRAIKLRTDELAAFAKKHWKY